MSHVLNQIIILIGIFILFVTYLYSLFYSAKKQVEYQDDERWQIIQSKANKVTVKYFQVLIFIFAVSSTILDFTSNMTMITLEKALRFGFYIIIISSIIELFAIKYYDKKL